MSKGGGERPMPILDGETFPNFEKKALAIARYSLGSLWHSPSRSRSRCEEAKRRVQRPGRMLTVAPRLIRVLRMLQVDDGIHDQHPAHFVDVQDANRTLSHKTPFPKSEGEFWGSSFQGYPGGQAMWLNERARFSSAICRTTRKTTLAALLPQRVQYIPLRSQYTWVRRRGLQPKVRRIRSAESMLPWIRYRSSCPQPLVLISRESPKSE
ncbi:hypothetical protein BDP67DRAFT_46975 [Colletotrichum lupini]|nr:hypothetical protein BDP67DRAFT_46975 [Colletotrichum lupini]